ncbi:MAG: CocE/NonD family hydrolase [Candidatus Obscuribacterales bacterium]|nr:CocE/NonD family hydrolase [Candidatus Obscuribacterales bacterium]
MRTTFSQRNAAPLGDFSVLNKFLRMPDGVKLAASFFIPRGKKGKKYPVLLEYLPYRKDDTFRLSDYPCFAYFAQRGFIAVKVDIRGTGASQGCVPDREYSDIELQDCEEIIKQLAALPQSNGNVGMFGVSWSGFNSLMMAQRQVPALKAVHAVHASDDLYHDDLHYIDGNLHLDPYHLFINHELALPRTPDYKLDKAYFHERFMQKPWIFKYLNQQLDGNFWQSKSLRQDPSRIKIPVYLIGGLLDGYRSATVRMHKELKVPVRTDIGPWNHSCPDEGGPGPNYEWQDELISWFSRYLFGREKISRAKEKEFLAFVRHGHAPNAELEETPGYWRRDSFPCKGSKNLDLSLQQAGPAKGKFLSLSSKSPVLKYKSASGMAAGYWWGEPTGDMSEDDKNSLCFDSQALKKPLQILGFPKVKLKVSAGSKKAKWTLRLEDVAPDGSVSLVTGALVNPSQRLSRKQPSLPPADRAYEIEADLQFTSWTFKAGHKIRLAVANAQFPICWPSPETMSSSVHFDNKCSILRLPKVPLNKRKAGKLPQPKEKPAFPDGEALSFNFRNGSETMSCRREDSSKKSKSYLLKSRSAYRIKRRRFYNESSNEWSSCESAPANAEYVGMASTKIVTAKRKLKLSTKILLRSDQDFFHLSVSRSLSENGKVLKRRLFKESIRRQFQ